MLDIQVLDMAWDKHKNVVGLNIQNIILSCYQSGKSNRKIIERGKIYTSCKQIHDCSLSWLGTDISVKSDRVKLVLWAQTSLLIVMMWSYKWFLHVREMSTLTYKHTNSLILKNVIILTEGRNCLYEAS
jgi:hypothetical protein